MGVTRDNTNPRFASFENLIQMPCGRSLDSDCPWLKCCAWNRGEWSDPAKQL